jgi:hypothetical protein
LSRPIDSGDVNDGENAELVADDRDLTRAAVVLIAIAMRLVHQRQEKERHDDHCLRESVDRRPGGVLP